MGVMDAVIEEWEIIPQNIIENLIIKIPRRMKVKSRGELTILFS